MSVSLPHMTKGQLMAKQVHLLVGTRKGAFILSSPPSRKKWSVQDPLLKGAEVNDMVLDIRTKPMLYAAVTSYWWGTNVHTSKNFGKSWEQSEGVKFAPEAEKSVARVWCVVPGRPSEPDVLYAGVDPGALFVSHDRDKTWSEVQSLTNHPTRDKWNSGAGGLMVHSIALHPTDTRKMFVAISAAGTFARPSAAALPCTVSAISGRIGRNSPTACRNAMRFSMCIAKRFRWMTSMCPVSTWARRRDTSSQAAMRERRGRS